MSFVGVYYPKGKMFDNISTSTPLYNGDDIESSLREEWNFPKCVAKLSNIKPYQDIDEIPLKNRFSCLSNILQKEIERCGSPPLINCGQKKSTPANQSKAIKTRQTAENARNSKLTRHKSMSELNEKRIKNKNAAENSRTGKIARYKSMTELNENQIEIKNAVVEHSRKSKIARHKSMLELNAKHIKTKAEKIRNAKISRNKSMTELHSTDKNEQIENTDGKLVRNKYISDHTKSMENLIALENSSNLKSHKSSRRPRKNRKGRKDLSSLQKSKSTSDLSDLQDADMLFKDQAYTDFSAMLKTVKQTLQDIIDKSNVEGHTENSLPLDESTQNKLDYIKVLTAGKLTKPNGNKPSKIPLRENVGKKKSNVQVSSLQIGNKIDKLSSSAVVTKASIDTGISETINTGTAVSRSDTTPCKVTSSIQRGIKHVKLDKAGSKPNLIPTRTLPVTKHIPIVSIETKNTILNVTTSVSIGTQTVSKYTSLVSMETQTVGKETPLVSIETQTVTEVIPLVSIDTQTVDKHRSAVSIETQTESTSTVVFLNSYQDNIHDGLHHVANDNASQENTCSEEETTSDGNDEGISEGESDTNDESSNEKAPTINVTPSRWLASMGMHKLCIFSQNDSARIKSYDYFLPQVQDFDPNIVVVHVGMSEFSKLKDGVDEEIPSVGEAIMKVVEICSDYGVRNVSVCNVKNRSTSLIRERRVKLKECLVQLCKKEGVRFKFNNKIYTQELPEGAVKLSVPDQWLCVECKSDQPWKTEDRKRVREEVLKCYDQINFLESNFKDADKEIKILRNFIKNATEDKESTEIKHKKETTELQKVIDDKSREVDRLKRNLKFRSDHSPSVC